MMSNPRATKKVRYEDHPMGTRSGHGTGASLTSGCWRLKNRSLIREWGILVSRKTDLGKREQALLQHRIQLKL